MKYVFTSMIHARTPMHLRYPFHHALLLLTHSTIHCSLPPLPARGAVWVGCEVRLAVWYIAKGQPTDRPLALCF